MKDGSKVYFAESENGLIKIGTTRWCPVTRVARICASSAVLVRLIAVFDGDREIEKSYHAQFSVFRRWGEWFACEGDLRTYVSAIRGEGIARVQDWPEVLSRARGGFDFSSEVLQRRSVAMKLAWSRPGAREGWFSDRTAKRAITPRKAEMLRLRSEGLTLAKIGVQFGVTRQCVHQIVGRRSHGTIA